MLVIFFYFQCPLLMCHVPVEHDRSWLSTTSRPFYLEAILFFFLSFLNHALTLPVTSPAFKLFCESQNSPNHLDSLGCPENAAFCFDITVYFCSTCVQYAFCASYIPSSSSTLRFSENSTVSDSTHKRHFLSHVSSSLVSESIYRTVCRLSQLFPLSVKKLSSIHCAIEGLILHSFSAILSLFLRKFS